MDLTFKALGVLRYGYGIDSLSHYETAWLLRAPGEALLRYHELQRLV